MSAIQFHETVSPRHAAFIGDLTANACHNMTIEDRHAAVLAICDKHGLEPRTSDREKIAAWAKVVRRSIAPCPVVDGVALSGLMLVARTSVDEILNRLEREMLEG